MFQAWEDESISSLFPEGHNIFLNNEFNLNNQFNFDLSLPLEEIENRNNKGGNFKKAFNQSFPNYFEDKTTNFEI